MIKTPDKNLRNFLRTSNGELKRFSKERNNALEEPTYYTFGIKFHMYPEHLSDKNGVPLPGTGSLVNGLLLDDTQIESSVNYLYRINHAKEAEMLKEFRNITDYLQIERPYYFQSVKGLNEIFKIPEPGQTRRLQDKILTFDTLESVDGIINHWMNLYRMSAYDWNDLKYLLPAEKNYFNFTIYVTEFSDLYTVKQKVDEIASQSTADQNTLSDSSLPNSGYRKGQNQANKTAVSPTSELGQAEKLAGPLNTDTKVFESLDDLIKIHTFTFSECQFDFNESFGGFEEISAATTEDPIVESFSIKLGNVQEVHQYGYFEWLLSTTQIGVPTAGIKLQYGVKDYVDVAKPIHQEVRPNVNEASDKNSYMNAVRAKNIENLNAVSSNQVSEVLEDGGMFADMTSKYLKRKVAQLKGGLNSKLHELKEDVKDKIKETIFGRTDLIDDLTWTTNSPSDTISNVIGDDWKTIPLSHRERIEQIDEIAIKEVTPSELITEINPTETDPHDDIIKVTPDEAPVSNQINNLDPSETVPSETINNLDFNEAAVDETINDLEHPETVPSETINDLDFNETSVDETINDLDFNETIPSETINDLDHPETIPSETINNLDFNEAAVDETINELDHPETVPSETINELDFNEAAVDETINELDHPETVPSETINELDHPETIPSENINELDFNETSVDETINQVGSETVDPPDTITPLQFTTVDPPDTITPLDFTTVDPSDKIQPIDFKTVNSKDNINEITTWQEV